MASPNRASQIVANVSVRHQVFLERLKRGQSKKAQAFLVEMDRALRLRIGATEFQRGRIEAQLSAIASDLRAIRGKADAALLADMRDVAEYEAGFEIRALGSITTNFTVAAPTQVYAAALSKPLSLRGPGGGKLIEPFVRGWSDAMVTNTIDTIRQGFFEGQTNAAILQAIRGTSAARNEDGLLARMSRGEEALVRTVVQHMASVAREEVWQANADLITGVQWLSVLDDRTTAVCQSLSGQIFPLDSGPRPPIHIGCRSTTTPAIDPKFAFLSNNAQQSSLFGPVDAKETYYSWLKQQDAGFQDAAIGPVRGKLFRDGGLSAERFAELNLGRNFNPLTLDQMREIEPLAFSRAGL